MCLSTIIIGDAADSWKAMVSRRLLAYTRRSNSNPVKSDGFPWVIGVTWPILDPTAGEKGKTWSLHPAPFVAPRRGVRCEGSSCLSVLKRFRWWRVDHWKRSWITRAPTGP